MIYTPIRVLFKLDGFELYSWGFMFVIAFLVSFLLVLREAKKQKIERKYIYELALIVLVSSVVGAKLFYCIEHKTFSLNALNPFSGGMTSYGGLFLSLILSFIYVKKRKLDLNKILDLFACYVALALAIGRIGCFLNGCCYGKPTNFFDKLGIAFVFPLSQTFEPRHPTQLYMIISNLTIFFILMKLKKKRKENGILFLLFLLLYSSFRFFVDFFRAYEIYFFGLSESQWICLALFIFSFILLLRKSKGFLHNRSSANGL